MNIKSNRPGIWPAAAALLLWLAAASCGNENGVFPVGDGSPVEEELVPLGIETSLDAEIAPSARAEVTSGSLGVYKYPNAVYNTEYAYISGAWTATTPILVGQPMVSVTAVYPRETPLATDGDKVTFPAFREYSAANDLCYAFTGTPASVSNLNPNINLTLKHLYARIRVKVGLATGDTGSGMLNSVKLEFYNTKNGTQGNAKISTAGIRISDGTLFAGTGTGATDYSQTIEETLTSGTTNDTFDMLGCSFDGWQLGGDAPDTEAVTAVIITVSFDGQLYQTKIPASTFVPGGLIAGKQYTVTLKLFRGVEVTAGSVTVNEWSTTSDAGSGGTVAPESDYYVLTATNPVTIGGIKWARTNLQQTGSGNSAPVSFVANPGDPGSSWSWGMRDASVYGNDVYLHGSSVRWTAASGDNADPCRVLGAGWRLPTQTELNSLVANKAANGTKVKINGTVYTTNGYGWAATANCAVFISNGQVLSLPATGYRDQGGSMNSQDSNGSYWASTPASESYYSYCLTSTASGIYVDSYYRNNGQFVRCVQQ